MKTVWKILAIVLLLALAVLLIWNIVSCIKNISIYSNYIKTVSKDTNGYFDLFVSPIINSSVRIILSIFGLFSCVFFAYFFSQSKEKMLSLLFLDSEYFKNKLNNFKNKRGESRRIRRENKKRKLQEKLNKYEES